MTKNPNNSQVFLRHLSENFSYTKYNKEKGISYEENTATECFIRAVLSWMHGEDKVSLETMGLIGEPDYNILPKDEG